jgi:hypothetical protein
MVEGERRKGDYGFSHVIGIGEHGAGLDPQNPITLRFETGVTRFVPLWSVASIVRFPIYLDHQIGRRCVKVHDIGVNRVLLSETNAHR